MNDILGNEALGVDDILGRVRRKVAAKKKAKNVLARVKALAALKARRKKGKPSPKRGLAKKPALKALWARLTPAKRREAMAKLIKKNPKLKKKLAVAVVAKRMADRKDGAIPSAAAVDTSPVPQTSPANIMPPPAAAPVPTEEAPTDAEVVSDEMTEAPLDEAADAEAATEEAAQDAQNDAAADATEKAEADAEEMAEETPEEAAESAEEAANDTAEAASEAAGDSILGFLAHARKRLRRRAGFIHRAVKKATPLAGEIERLSGGEIEASHILGAVKTIAKAKKGDKKAKAGIKAVTKLAAKKGPAQKKAKKAVAKLKIAHKVMKKTGTAKGTGKKAKVLAKKKAAPFSKKVVVQNTGLNSYSAYQRGMAQIPGTARAHFGTYY